MEARTISVSPSDIRANRLDLITRLADDLAHEVKNPLHAMVINLELLRRRLTAGGVDAALERVAVVESEVARVNRLMDAYFQLLRPGRDRATRCDVATALGEVAPLVEALSKVARVEQRIHTLPVGVLVDLGRDELKLLIMNLVVNALDALRGTGGRLELHLAGDETQASLRITDSGPGVAAEIRGRIGQPGVSTRPGRAGMGLAVVRALAEAAGGRLEPADGAGGGASFLVVLPRASTA